MAYKIIKEMCMGCGGCKMECPVEAIYADGEKFVIKKEECIECGNCFHACLMGAISIE